MKKQSILYRRLLKDIRETRKELQLSLEVVQACSMITIAEYWEEK